MKKKARKSYILRLLISVDQLFNVLLLNGNEDHTISGRVGYMSMSTNKWYWNLAEYLIDKLFWFDLKHCYNSIESDRVYVTRYKR